ncbi:MULTISPECIES: anti-sigma factor [Streptacidiphilus]|uniref:Anti-sigma factor n=2 Tax=Streptacidiphilus TaxID=228398 RepID=A0ABV6UHJ8_9ACTN|nr:zf-HC2 domain-containing protein [Streptacidiphilus jeojiense]
MTEQPHRARRPEVLVELRVDRSAAAPAVQAVEEQHLGDRLAAFIDGELDHDGRERVQAHLATCSACLSRAEEERRIKSRIAAALPPDPSALFLAKLMGIAGDDDGDRQPPSAGGTGRRGFGGSSFGGSNSFGGADSFGANGFGSGRFGSNALGADHPVPGVDPRAERGSRLFQSEQRPIAARLRAGFAPGDSRPENLTSPEPTREQTVSRPSAARGRRFAFAAAGAFSVAAVALGSAITGVSSAEPTVDEPYGNVAPVADTAGSTAGVDNAPGGYGRNSGQLAFGVSANLPGEFSQPLVVPSASVTSVPAAGSEPMLRSVTR